MLCCDLLSIQYFCTTANNCSTAMLVSVTVVICFQFSIFALQQTTPFFTDHPTVSCDLLSIQYFCTTANNEKLALEHKPKVVICFQFSIFALQQTTFCLLIYSVVSCDLLSIQYFCTTANNHCSLHNLHLHVVICFQFSIFALQQTTFMLLYILRRWL